MSKLRDIRCDFFNEDGYFICSVGNVSEKTLKEYIENQG